jgi:hypothetical protein
MYATRRVIVGHDEAPSSIIWMDSHVIARIERACSEIGREVAIRRSFYPEWVRRRKITQAKADEQIGALEDAASLLRELSGVSR